MERTYLINQETEFVTPLNYQLNINKLKFDVQELSNLMGIVYKIKNKITGQAFLTINLASILENPECLKNDDDIIYYIEFDKEKSAVIYGEDAYGTKTKEYFLPFNKLVQLMEG